MRLEEEYAHKETLAKSFMVFRKQVEKAGEEDARALSSKLLEATLLEATLLEATLLEATLLEATTGTLESNASQVPDKNHDDGMPGADTIKKIERLKKALTPG